MLHPHALADSLEAALPAGAAGMVALLRNWTYSLFFCACELWGGVVISLLFWSLANEARAVPRTCPYLLPTTTKASEVNNDGNFFMFIHANLRG